MFIFSIREKSEHISPSQFEGFITTYGHLIWLVRNPMKFHATMIHLYGRRCTQTLGKSVCCSAINSLKHRVSFI